MLEDVIIKKTSNPDDGYTDEDDLFLDTLTHIDDVGKVMNMLANHMDDIGDWHDNTKLEFFEEFSKDTLERKSTPDFKQREWYGIHTSKERHHVNACVPDKVDFFDLLEMIVDCCVAGKARVGVVNDEFLIISDDILKDAYWNTVKKIKDSIILEK